MRRIGNVTLLLATVLAVTVAGLYLTGAIPYRVYVVHTGSMSPAIPSKSAVLVRVGRYHVGQVVSFAEHGTVVTHRLVGTKSDGTVITKGDADRSVDPWVVRKADIVGGVVAAPHLVGYALVYLRTPAGAASVLLALLALWQTAALARDLGRPEPL
jgi:signal peptidase